MKLIYFFDEGNGKDKKLLGGKGAGLCEMTQLGLQVPPGFVITTQTCKLFFENGNKLPDGLMNEVRMSIKKLESLTGKKFGDSSKPLLVSVRSGAAISMPGMMDTILNLGLNDNTVKGLASLTKNERFAYDAYRRFVQLFGKIVLGIDDGKFAEALEDLKRKLKVKYDSEIDVKNLKNLVNEFKNLVKVSTGKSFPEDPWSQLENAIAAVFNSWNGRRAKDYRREFKITPEIADGTAVNIVTMAFGNMGNDSGTGVVFTRDPSSGERKLYGDYLPNAQGEDVVAGIRTPMPIDELQKQNPAVYKQLVDIAERLEKYFKEPQDIEFTVEQSKLFMLQTRNAKMNTVAQVKTSVDMVHENLITKERAIIRVPPEQLEQLLHKRVDSKSTAKPFATGIPASPGVATGKVVLDADQAEMQGTTGNKVILVREETKPDDIHGFFASQGILTSKGGKTSHAAVVARGMDKPCVCGASALRIDHAKKRIKVGDLIIKEGEIITIDGTNGNVYVGTVPTVQPQMGGELLELLSWADSFRKLGVRANVDDPESAFIARSLGAEGIGLCRTERMFNASDRLPIMVQMVMSEDEKTRKEYLAKLKPLQKQDFKELLKVMDGLPVTIRLLDPPLHEFLPQIETVLSQIQSLKRTEAYKEEIREKEMMLEKVKRLTEINPMLGHRGVRIGITYPEIYEMQVAAICEATAELMKEGMNPKAQIMVPQVASEKELQFVKDIVQRTKTIIEKQYNLKLPIKFGTMIEVVRGCLVADKIAEIAEFFSFGTNDLTQGTFSFSREDSENKFLPQYMKEGIILDNPFQSLDKDGVGRLMQMAIEGGKGTDPRIEIGICGEHGGDPRSIEFCSGLGLNYVSCSAYRIPIARLAAAQAAVRAK
ncbi:MAG TPA: pyruvate, phosphate dikinase [Nitrososphaerales archaeon]